MKNGRIELLRFLFCASVVLYHMQTTLHVDQDAFGGYLSFFMHGRSGVEFFFIVSGVFMASHALRLQDSDILPGKDTMIFMVGKIKRILVPYLIVVGLTCIHLALTDPEPVKTILYKLPSVFLLQETGIWPGRFVGVAWYLSSMLIGMALIYPFLRINYDVTARAAAPILSILMIGYLIEHYKALPNGVHFDLIDTGNLRAVAILLLGVAVFELSNRMKEHHVAEVLGWRLTLIELACYAGVFYYINSTLDLRYDGLFALLTAAGVLITMSKDQSSILNNRLVYFLGDASLSIFLVQNVARHAILPFVKDMDINLGAKLAITFTGIVLAGIAVHFASKGLTILLSRWYGGLKNRYLNENGVSEQ